VDYCFVNTQLSGIERMSRMRERRFSLRHPSLTLPARRRNYEVDKARSSVTNGLYRRSCNGLNVPRGTLGLANLGKPNVPRGTLGITNLGKGGNRPSPTVTIGWHCDLASPQREQGLPLLALRAGGSGAAWHPAGPSPTVFIGAREWSPPQDCQARQIIWLAILAAGFPIQIIWPRRRIHPIRELCGRGRLRRPFCRPTRRRRLQRDRFSLASRLRPA